MKETEVIWEKTEGKRKVKIAHVGLECDCGGNIVSVGTAGCAHNENWTYFLQCLVCKTVFTKGYLPHGFGEDLSVYGWKRNLTK